MIYIKLASIIRAVSWYYENIHVYCPVVGTNDPQGLGSSCFQNHKLSISCKVLSLSDILTISLIQMQRRPMLTLTEYMPRISQVHD